MISSIDPNFSLHEAEYAYTLEDLHEFYGGMKVKVYIPKLMPDININKGLMSVKKKIYSGSIYVNDNSCSPSCEDTITHENYIEGIVNYNSNYEHLLDNNGIIPKGTRLKCTFMNGDINKCYLDTDID